MSDLKICRICLCKGAKVYNYNQFNLKLYYEQVMAKKINQKDGLPHNFCYVCAAMLYKFCKFKEKCCTGEKALKELLWHGPITLSSVSQINRQEKNLQIPIGIITVSKRVKTYIVINKSLTKSLLKNIKKVKSPEIEICKVDYDSDNSTDNKNLAEIKNEIDHKVDSFEIEKTETNIQQIDTDEKLLPNNEEDCKTFSDDDNFDTDNINKLDITVVKNELSNQVIDENELLSNHTIKTIQDVDKAVQKNHKEKKRKRPKINNELSENETANTLDPNHWLKINLSEEEALEEFRARAQEQRYLSAAYQCTDCFKGFSKEDMLNRHIKLRHSESLGPVVCRFCNMRFKWKCYLTRHITQHYTKYKCLRCDIMCPLKTTALFHNEYHNGVMRKCMHCGEEFRHLSTYYTHLRTHRSEHVCTLCGASFVSTMGLNMHRRTMHINTVINPEEDVNTYCERCDVTFETRKAYEEHVFHSAKHAEGIEDLALQYPAPSIPKRKKKSSRRNPRKLTPCTICNKIFPSQTAYMKHHMTEHKEEPLPSRETQRHICEICGTSLVASSIASHLNTHTREKLYSCTTCRMQFNSKSSMKRHQLTHTGEKPYGCTLCEKRFTQKSSMKLHYRTFHLKEPYPKRNRRKNTETQGIDDYRINEEDSEENPKIDRWR